MCLSVIKNILILYKLRYMSWLVNMMKGNNNGEVRKTFKIIL